MPYPAGHRAKVQRRIIDSARRLFNRHGFESVSIEQIMAGAGLTHGGFYTYFRSKSDLYSHVLGCFFTDPEWKIAGRVCTSISPRPTSDRRLCVPIFRASTSKISKTRVPWSPCPRT